MKKHTDFLKNQEYSTEVTKGAKFKNSHFKAKSLCPNINTKITKSNEYVVFNPSKESKSKSRLVVSKSSLPVYNQKSTNSSSLKLLEDLPIKPKKNVDISPFENYCLFDPETDFHSEREYVLGTIPETHAVENNDYSFVNITDSHYYKTKDESFNFDTIAKLDFDELYQNDGCEMTELSNIKEITDIEQKKPKFTKIPTKQIKTIEDNKNETKPSMLNKSQTFHTQTGIHNTSDTTNIHELITVINKSTINYKTVITFPCFMFSFFTFNQKVKLKKPVPHIINIFI